MHRAFTLLLKGRLPAVLVFYYEGHIRSMFCTRHKEEILHIPGLTLTAKVWGSSRMRPLVALHGWLDNASSFDGLAPLLPGFHLIAVDLPGHGHSDHRPVGYGYHPLDWVVDVIRAIDQLELGRFALLGHSMGAGIACKIAGVIPERVERLILLEGLGTRSTPLEQTPDYLLAYIEDSDRFARIPKRKHPFRFEVAVRAKKVASRMSDKAARTLIERSIERVNGGGYLLRSDPRLQYTQPRYLTEEQNQMFLRRIRCPTLFIRASHGIPMDPELVHFRMACIRHFSMVEVAGGHHVHLDEPQIVAPHIVTFLDSAEP